MSERQTPCLYERAQKAYGPAHASAAVLVEGRRIASAFERVLAALQRLFFFTIVT